MRRTRTPWIAVCALTGLLGHGTSRSADVDHAPWDALLKRHVDDRGYVDYAGLAADRSDLERYLASLAEVEPAGLGSDAERTAFWINAYNAATVRGVLEHLPLASVRSVEGFFDAIRYPIAGEDLTLNGIETRARARGGWQVHFALVCASAGCPNLRDEAYVAGRLEAQLEDQTREFLGDPRKGLRLEGSTLWLSRIFDWYSADFVDGLPTAPALLPVLEPYLDPQIARSIREKRPSVKFLEYDWALNGAPEPRR